MKYCSSLGIQAVLTLLIEACSPAVLHVVFFNLSPAKPRARKPLPRPQDPALATIPNFSASCWCGGAREPRASFDPSCGESFAAMAGPGLQGALFLTFTSPAEPCMVGVPGSRSHNSLTACHSKVQGITGLFMHSNQ